MSALFGPKQPNAVPVVNPADTANRANQQMVARLQAGGTNADSLAPGGSMAAVGGGRMPSLTGLN